MCSCLCSVIVLWSVGWWWKEGRRWNPVPAHSLLFSKSTKGAARFNVPIRQTYHYQQYYMPSQRIYCRRFWNLIQVCDVQSSDWKVYISTLLAPRLKIFKLKFTTSPGIEPWTCWTRGRHATIWASTAPVMGIALPLSTIPNLYNVLSTSLNTEFHC